MLNTSSAYWEDVDEDGKTGADDCWAFELLLAMKSGVMHVIAGFGLVFDEFAVDWDVLDDSVSNALLPGNRVAYDGGGSISS